MTDSTVIREEYFDNEPTGVEIELDDETPEAVRPWDPAKIRVGTKQFSLRNILDLISDGDLDLAPDFQRNKVWKPRQKSRLIESVLLQIPLPAFYFAEDANGMMRVVDGLQRLSTVRGYVREREFALADLEYLRHVDGEYFDDLPPAMQRRINNAQIIVHVIDPTTPSSVKYDIFKRINTGGTPLKPQEIRHCMSSDRSRSFLKRCTHAPEFDDATGGGLRDHVRMDDREMVLRFCAFWLRGVQGYGGSMDSFLEVTTEMLDDPKKVSDAQLDQLYLHFQSAMRNCYYVFGEYAFRKWPRHSKKRNPINRTLFESWSYALGRHSEAELIHRREEVIAAARKLMTDDMDYIEAISTSTGDPRKVSLRFTRAEQAARAGR